MKTLSAALAASLLLTACASGPGPETRREFYERRVLRANPSKVIATELAFARAAQEKGQWTAFAEYAADDAVMFVPEPVDAKAWLKQQVNPPRAVTWQPHQVWSSCDGTLAVTKGAWQRPDGSVGYFTTVWERQRDGEYKWVMDQGDVLAEPLEAPEMVGATAADCGNQGRENLLISVMEAESEQSPNRQLMISRDKTLLAMWLPTDGGREFHVRMQRNGSLEEVLSLTVREE